MLENALPAVVEGDLRALEEVEEIDDEIDALHGQIAAYLARIGEARLSEQAGRELIGLMESTNDLEAIGDIIETNLVGLGRIRFEHNIVVSPQTREVLEEFHGAVLRAFEASAVAPPAKVLALSPRVVEDLKRFHPGAQAILRRPGVDLARFRPLEIAGAFVRFRGDGEHVGI